MSYYQELVRTRNSFKDRVFDAERDNDYKKYCFFAKLLEGVEKEMNAESARMLITMFNFVTGAIK